MTPGPVVLDIDGTSLAPAERERLRHPLVGMVILFARNFESASQLARLTAEIRALRAPPLLIAVDHEGGRVQRFRDPPFTRIPPMAALGKLWDRDVLLACRAAVSAGYAMAAELRAHGVDLTFAPVLDIDWGHSSVIGDRALHRDARTVAMLAGHLSHGMALAGMANCGKHFPGHGWPAADSHVDVPIDERPLDAILAADAAPYGWLGGALAAVMPAHVIFPAVDPMPAGFSRRWIQDVLRGRLGFTGAVFSDDLSMAGARVAGSVADGAQAAIDAGCDFVIACGGGAVADELLGRMRWRRSAAFDERLRRITPLGAALSAPELAASARYRAARAAVEAWVATLA